MTPGIEYAFGAMLCFGIGDLIYKRGAAAGVQPHQFMMLQSWVFLSTVTLYGLLTGSLHFVAGTLWGCLAGLFMVTGFYNFAHSLRTGSISVNAPVFRLSFVMTVVLAIVMLGEPLTSNKVAGVVLALVAVWLLLAAPVKGAATGPNPDDASVRRARRSSLKRVLLATLAVGIGNVIYKYGLRAGATPASLIVAQACVVVSTSTLLTAVLERNIRPPAIAWRHAPLAGIVLGVAFILLVQALVRGEASVMVPIAQMGFVVTALLGFLFLREPFTLRKGAGLVAAVAALASLAAG
jgi:drug/metabolite transporter (DMT)-like permease